MALITKNPTSNTTPDPGQGGIAVTGNINTGHGTTTSVANRTTTGTTSQTKTCLWSAVQPVSGQILSINLKFDWQVSNGSVSVNTLIGGDSGTATIQFTIDYSTNGGGAWTNKVTQSRSVSFADGADGSDTLSSSASETQSIALGTALDQIQVRDRIHATVTVIEEIGGSVVADATLDVIISSIRVEVTTVDAHLLIMM